MCVLDFLYILLGLVICIYALKERYWFDKGVFMGIMMEKEDSGNTARACDRMGIHYTLGMGGPVHLFLAVLFFVKT